MYQLRLNQLRLNRFIRLAGLHLLPLILLAGFAVVLTRAHQVLEFDTDEGINLMKAMLYGRGFSLYTEIWNDQPPLFTVLLSHWLQLFGQSILAARLLVLLFAGVLVWSFYQILRTTSGVLPAIAGTLLLVTSWTFARLSVSIMIGLPSLSVAMLAIYCLIRYQQNRQFMLLVSSGVLLAFSLQIKLITAFLVPLLLIYLVLFKLREFDGTVSAAHHAAETTRNLKRANRSETQQQGDRPFAAVLIWILALAVGYGLSSFLLQSIHLDQLVQTHLHERAKAASQEFSGLESLMTYLRRDLDYLLLGALGIVAVFIYRKPEGLLPIAWFCAAFLLLATHHPVWYHHYLLLSIPICWLAAYAIASVEQFFKSKLRFNRLSNHQLKGLFFSSLVIVLLILAIGQAPERFAQSINKIPVQDQQVTAQIAKYQLQTRWMFTDRPAYAFSANLPVPPEIAVMSRKRFSSGMLTINDLLTVLETYQPEQIVLAKYLDDFRDDRELQRYIREHYVRTYRNRVDPIEHYVSRRLIRTERTAS